MTMTMWIALFCLVISVGSIAIRVAMPQASLFVEAVPNQSGMAPVPNESAKSDRLELPNIRAETAIAPVAQAAPVETPSTKIETTKTETNKTETNKIEANKIPRRRWRDANASVAPLEQPQRHNITREPNKSADSNPPKARAEVWHCRQDAMGSLLRSLDLSPRCDL
ncbi:MAG: hypothetical protein ACLQDM_11630 [Bradyrhizobium sp.]